MHVYHSTLELVERETAPNFGTVRARVLMRGHVEHAIGTRAQSIALLSLSAPTLEMQRDGRVCGSERNVRRRADANAPATATAGLR